MEIAISNLGIIKDAVIDLNKRLSIFCGQNNTGKTYLSYIVYAISKNVLYRNIKFNDLPKIILNEPVCIDLDIDKVFEVIRYTESSVKSNFGSIFGISEDQVESLFAETEINVKYNKEELTKRLLSISSANNLSTNQTKVSFKKEQDSLKITIELTENDEVELDDVLCMFMLSAIYKYFAFYPLRGTFISPVERNSIYTFSKELSITRNNLIDHLQKGGDFNPFDLILKNTNRYPIAITDGLSISNDLANLQKKRSEYFHLAENIESDLLNGQLSVTDKGELVFSSNKNKAKKLPIHMTASIVKTLSSLVFYLKYLANHGDLIIIDEPEMNLHPNNQIVLTRLFARLLQYKFRLLISTHSDYIIRELNNLIMLNNILPKSESMVNELGYNIEDGISADDIGCYFFRFKQHNSRKVTVERINVTNNGISIPTIDETIDEQNRIAEELMYLNMNID